MITVTYDFFEKKLRSAEDFVNPSNRKATVKRRFRSLVEPLNLKQSWRGIRVLGIHAFDNPDDQP